MTNNSLPYIVQWEHRVSFKEGIPSIRKQKIDFANKKFVLINEVSKIPIEQRKNYILLFFAEDKYFNAFYTDLNSKRLSFLQSFYAICGLDFSTFPSLDEDENRAAIKRNRRFCTFCQRNDILCIYNIVWSSSRDFNLAFSRVEMGSTIIVSTYRIGDSKDCLFELGYHELKRIIQPEVILCYGKPQSCMEQDLKTGLVRLIPTRYEIVKREKFERSGQSSFIDLLMSA